MIGELHVWHLRKSSGDLAPTGWDAGDLFTLETCQRWIGVSYGVPATPMPWAFTAAAECHQGVEAYAFLLRHACGLESLMVGETEVFGQVKERWRAFTAEPSRQSANLAPVFQKLFEDVKTVRRSHLQNLGQASYGSLLRRLLTQTPLKRPVMVLGAGHFAQSLLPWLAAFEVRLANRTEPKAQALAATLQNEGGAFQKNPLTVVPWDEALYSEIQGHCHLVACVADDGGALTRRVAAWAALAPQGTLFFDLGEPGLWPADAVVPSAVNHVTLNDLYALQKKEENLRTLEVQRARLAIEGLAARRFDSMHITLSHGWEDLWSYGA
jgi:glutamyl-tRNA reductase